VTERPGSRPRVIHRVMAHLVRATALIDRGARLFDRARSRLVLGLGSDAFFETFNDVAYASERSYRTADLDARQGLFDWEQRLVRDCLPPPPATILVGAAGGGRESLALAHLGYSVVAFEPVARLAGSLAHVAAAEPRIEPLLGRYEDLPVLRRLDQSGLVNLAERLPFDAALFGWVSFSHGTDTRRIDALCRVASLTRGPIVVSYFPASAQAPRARRATFSIWIGYYREISPEDLGGFARAAGLAVTRIDEAGSFAALERVDRTATSR
jgi:hypothetical protein